MQNQKPALAYGMKKVEYAKRVREAEFRAAPASSGGFLNGFRKIFS